jgi:hypothetical protein
MRWTERIPAVNSLFLRPLTLFGSLPAIPSRRTYALFQAGKLYALFQLGGLIRYSKQEDVFVIPT